MIATLLRVDSGEHQDRHAQQLPRWILDSKISHVPIRVPVLIFIDLSCYDEPDRPVSALVNYYFCCKKQGS